MKRKKALFRLSHSEFIDSQRSKGKSDQDIFTEMTERYDQGKIAKWISNRPFPNYLKAFTPLHTSLLVLIVLLIALKVFAIVSYPRAFHFDRYPFHYQTIILGLGIFSFWGVLKHFRFTYLVLGIVGLVDVIFNLGEMRSIDVMVNEVISYTIFLLSLLMGTEYYKTAYGMSKVQKKENTYLFPTTNLENIKTKTPKILTIIFILIYGGCAISYLLLLTGFRDVVESWGVIGLVILFPLTIIYIFASFAFLKRPADKLTAIIIMGFVLLFSHLGMTFLFDMRSQIQIASGLLNVSVTLLLLQYVFAKRMEISLKEKE